MNLWPFWGGLSGLMRDLARELTAREFEGREFEMDGVPGKVRIDGIRVYLITF